MNFPPTSQQPPRLPRVQAVIDRYVNQGGVIIRDDGKTCEIELCGAVAVVEAWGSVEWKDALETK